MALAGQDLGGRLENIPRPQGLPGAEVKCVIEPNPIECHKNRP